jgi:hypothetical protein
MPQHRFAKDVMRKRFAISEYSRFLHRKIVIEYETLQVDENWYVIVVDHRKTDILTLTRLQFIHFSHESVHVVQRIIFDHSIVYNETIGGSVCRYIFFTIKF